MLWTHTHTHIECVLSGRVFYLANLGGIMDVRVVYSKQRCTQFTRLSLWAWCVHKLIHTAPAQAHTQTFIYRGFNWTKAPCSSWIASRTDTGCVCVCMWLVRAAKAKVLSLEHVRCSCVNANNNLTISIWRVHFPRFQPSHWHTDALLHVIYIYFPGLTLFAKIPYQS